MKLYSHLIIFVTIWISSCSTQIASEDLDELPVSSGSYRGSVIYDKWSYLGESKGKQVFEYKWHTDNVLHSKKIHIYPKVDMNLKEEHKINTKDDGVIYAVELIGVKGEPAVFKSIISESKKIANPFCIIHLN